MELVWVSRRHYCGEVLKKHLASQLSFYLYSVSETDVFSDKVRLDKASPFSFLIIIS